MRISLSISIYLILLSLLMTVGLLFGPFELQVEELFHIIWNYEATNKLHYIVLNLRLPRIILAFMVGGCLALAGYLMQAMVNNPLADPYLLGTASGASLGVNLGYIFFLPIAALSFLPISFFAFIGALGITLLAVVAGTSKGNIIPSRLLLAGIAFSSLAMSIMSFVIFLSGNDNKLKAIIFWSMGSFEKASWSDIPMISATLLLVTVLFSFLTKQLNILLLGEIRSTSLGLNVKVLRWVILLTSAFVTSLAVAASGPVGFVGLMVPHFVRSVWGVHGKFNILYTVLTGGVFILACDLISKLIYPPSGIPIGIITSFLGIPFFVYLLYKKNYSFS
jgi:iron complex transport system permease protein